MDTTLTQKEDLSSQEEQVCLVVFKWKKLYHDYLRGLKALEKEAETLFETCHTDFADNHSDLYRCLYCAINTESRQKNDPYLIDYRM